MNIKKTLKRMSRRARSSGSFRRELLQKMVPQAHGGFSALPLWRAAAAVLVAAIAVGTATGVYAYASDDVLPTHPLYGVRTAIEHAEASLAPEGSLARANVELKHLEKRTHEIDLMREQHVPLKDMDVQRVTEAVAAAIKDVPEDADAETFDERIRHAEMKSADCFQHAAVGNEAVQRAFKDGIRNLGLAIRKLNKNRRSHYENIELRYEAELFGMEWKLDNGKVVLENEDKDVDAIVEHLPAESVHEVVTVASEQVIEGTLRDEDSVPESDTEKERDSYADKHFSEDSGALYDDAQVNRIRDGSFGVASYDKDRNGDEDTPYSDNQIVRERLQNYFDRLRLQR